MSTAAATTTTPAPVPAAEPERRISIIMSKGSLDMAYPGLILGNAARMTGVEVTLFFTFWGLDIITESKVDKLHVSTVGNPSLHVPTLLGGLPGIEALASRQMKKEIKKLELPTIRELLKDLADSGAKIYACQMAMDMFKLKRGDLLPQVDGVLSAMDFFDKSVGSQVIFI
jgi:peroxiredoxin family protein